MEINHVFVKLCLDMNYRAIDMSSMLMNTQLGTTIQRKKQYFIL